HVPDGEVAERHRRSERQAGLVADTLLGGGCSIAGGIKARDGMTPLVDHPSMNVCKQPERRSTSRAQFDAVEGRLCYRTKAAIAPLGGIHRSKFPLVFAALKIFVRSAFDKAIEAAGCFLQLFAIDPELRRQLQ